jgi:hypothetical protein
MAITIVIAILAFSLMATAFYSDENIYQMNDDTMSRSISLDDFSPCNLTIDFDDLPTPHPGVDYYGNPADYTYGDPIKDHYASLGVLFDSDDIPTNSTGVNEISYPNSVFGGYPPWSAKEIAVTISPPSSRVGAWTIDAGGIGTPAGNEATARFYDSLGNLLGTVYADPNLIPARQFLGLEASEGISKVTFRETNRPGDIVDDFYIDNLIIDRECEDEIIPAEVDCDPDTLNLKSKGKWITCYIEFPSGFGVRDINLSSVLLEDILPPEMDEKYGFVSSEASYIMDHDNDGVEERMVKFDRQELIKMLQAGEYSFKLTGSLFDGTVFEGNSDIIRVIH